MKRADLRALTAYAATPNLSDWTTFPERSAILVLLDSRLYEHTTNSRRPRHKLINDSRRPPGAGIPAVRVSVEEITPVIDALSGVDVADREAIDTALTNCRDGLSVTYHRPSDIRATHSELEQLIVQRRLRARQRERQSTSTPDETLARIEQLATRHRLTGLQIYRQGPGDSRISIRPADLLAFLEKL